MTREEIIKGLGKIGEFFRARADMAAGDGKMLLLNWMKCAEEAAEAMKAQEPRVMTLEEVLRLKFDDVVFFEMSFAGVVISAIVIDVIEHMPDGDIGLIQFRHIQEPTNNADLEYYGKTWRCWTSRPTDVQRKETAWPGA